MLLAVATLAQPAVAQPTWAGPPVDAIVDVTVEGSGTQCQIFAVSRARTCSAQQDDPEGQVCQWRTHGNQPARITWFSATAFALVFQDDIFVPNRHCDLGTLSNEKTCQIRQNAPMPPEGYKYDVVIDDDCSRDPRVFLTR